MFDAFITRIDLIIAMFSLATVYFVCERNRWFAPQYAIYLGSLFGLLHYLHTF